MPLEQLSRTNSGVGWIANLDAMLMGLILAVLLMMAAVLELSRTRGNAAALGEEVSRQQQVIDNMTRNIEEQRTRLAAAGQESRELNQATEAQKARIAALNLQYHELNKTAQEQKERLATANLKTGTIERENEQLRQQLAEVPKRIEASLKAAEDREKHLRQELLGIKARNEKLDRVVFVIDRSGSMAVDNRWEFVRNTIRDWVKYLPFRDASLVVFNHTIAQFPQDRSYISVTSEGANPFDDYLSGLQPAGKTNTLQALQTAFQYRDANAIILFTDGQPTSSSIEAVLNEIIRQDIKIPINVVGLGDYFKKERFGRFLQSLAEQSGGVFIGK